MPDFEKIRRAKNAARPGLRARAGVHGVAIGPKFVDGKRTAEPAIQIFVLKKRPSLELSPSEFIPMEIDGIKTDVIEAPMFKLHQSPPQFPSSLTVTQLTNPHIIEVDSPPPLGGAGPPGIPSANWSISLTLAIAGGSDPQPVSHLTKLGDTLQKVAADLASKIVKAINNAMVTGVNATANPTNDGKYQVVIVSSGPTDVTFSGSATVRYLYGSKSAPLVGGIRIAAGPPELMNNFGTLGCFVTDASASKYYALTCYHVVAPIRAVRASGSPSSATTPLQVQINSARTSIIFGISPPETTFPTSRVVLELKPTNTQKKHVSIPYVTSPNQDLSNVTGSISALINAAGLNSTASGNSISLADSTLKSCLFANASLATAIKSTVDANSNHQDAVTFGRGPVNGPNYGVFTLFDVPSTGQSNGPPTYGIFTPIPKDTKYDGISSIVAPQISPSKISGLPANVSASGSGNTLNIPNITNLECIVSDDITVGQPDHGINTIGNVAAARLDVDAALIELSSNISCDTTISQIPGTIYGTYDVTAADAMAGGGFSVRKCGARTQYTEGNITSTDFDGDIGIYEGYVRSFYGALLITTAPGGPEFSEGGDSGSAILDNRTSNYSVVGILNGGTPTQVGGSRLHVATPISQILQAFNAMVNGIQIVKQGPFHT